MYMSLAEQLHLDTKQFGTCLGDKTFKAHLQDEIKLGMGLGIEGTPAFFVGRIEGNKIVDLKSLVGAQPIQAFSNLIDSYLD